MMTPAELRMHKFLDQQEMHQINIGTYLESLRSFDSPEVKKHFSLRAPRPNLKERRLQKN